MLILFDFFNAQNRHLHDVLLKANPNADYVVINDNGFLPENMTSIVNFYTKHYAVKKGLHKAMYFNELPVPDLYQIAANNEAGQVFHMNQKVADIHFSKLYPGKRLIESVDWLDKDAKVVVSNFYNRFGFLYKRNLYNAAHELILTSYLNEDGVEVITINPRTKDIIVNFAGQTRVYHSLTEFTVATIKLMGISYDKLIYDSLSTPLFVNKELNQTGDSILIWHESLQNKQIPGNMLTLADMPKQRVLFQNLKDFNQVSTELAEKKVHADFIGAAYREIADSDFNHEVTIVTASDSLEGLEELLTNLGEYTFNVVAKTLMSNKLHSLGERYRNLKLFPSQADSKISEFISNSGIYLDINNGTKIPDVIEQVLANGKLIYSLDSTVGDQQLIPVKQIYPSVEKLLQTLSELNPDVYQLRVDRQYRDLKDGTFEAYFEDKLFS